MGNVSSTLQPRQDWAQSDTDPLDAYAEYCGAAPLERPGVGEPIDVGDPLCAARGAILALALGSLFWGGVLWALL